MKKAIRMKSLLARCYLILLALFFITNKVFFDSNTNGILPNIEQPKCRCVDCEEDKICGGLWRGTRYPLPGSRIGNTPNGDVDLGFDEKAYLVKQKIHLVVSHCSGNLNWIADFTKGFKISSIHVVTKCGIEVVGAPTGATIEKMPNVGRCDHTYAHYITTIMDQKVKKGEESNSIVFFLKDDISGSNMHINGMWSQFELMLHTASSENGFACGSILEEWLSAYADVKELFGYKLYEYFNYRHTAKGYDTTNIEFRGNYTDVGSFYNKIPGIESPPEIVQVCYGGAFAASVSSIKKRDLAFWKYIEKVLSRGDNIQEGHYVERSWASFISKPLESFQIEALRNYTTGLDPGDTRGSLQHWLE